MITTATLEKSPIEGLMRLIVIKDDKVSEFYIDKFFINNDKLFINKQEVRLLELPTTKTVQKTTCKKRELSQRS